MVRVLVCDQVEIGQLGLGAGFDVTYNPGLPRDALLKTVGDYEVLVFRSRTKVDRELIDRGTKLKLVARPGTGLDNVDVEYVKSKGITVVNSPESLIEAVAEHVTLLMLALSRSLTVADVSTKAGLWDKEKLKGTELKGKTLGIVGLGRIGRRIAEIAGVLGMSVLVHDVIPIPPEVTEELRCKVVGLDELFSSADFVTLHVPLTADTHHMVDSKRLSSMRRDSRIINTSRGGVIDESALADALRRGAIAGAALDVFETEPPTGGILSAPNTILTPHIGGQTQEAQTGAIESIGTKIREFFERL